MGLEGLNTPNGADLEALFKSGDAIIIEKFCHSYLQTEKFAAIMTFYDMLKQ
jgi:hypothetical protein